MPTHCRYDPKNEAMDTYRNKFVSAIYKCYYRMSTWKVNVMYSKQPLTMKTGVTVEVPEAQCHAARVVCSVCACTPCISDSVGYTIEFSQCIFDLLCSKEDI